MCGCLSGTLAQSDSLLLSRPRVAGPAFSSQPYGAADAAAVRAWLAARGLGKYAPLFEANEVCLPALVGKNQPHPSPAPRAAISSPEPAQSS
jgi:hypothetical protein